MGPATLGPLIPIIAMMIGGFMIFARSDIGRAFAQRLRGGAETGELAAQVEALRGEVEALRAELVETQERLDFTERLIASRSEVS